jgi:hypothetical protein
MWARVDLSNMNQMCLAFQERSKVRIYIQIDQIGWPT